MVDLAQEAESSIQISTGYRRYVLGLLLVVAIFNYADRYLLGILIPDIKADLDLSDTQIGFISGAAFTILYAFLGVPIARLADRFSRKKIIAASLAVWSLMTCLCGSAQSFIQLAVFRVLVGIGEAGCTPPSHSLISDYYKRERRTSALAIFGLGSPIGVFIGFLVGGWVVDLAGWRLALFAFGAPGIIVALILYFTLRDIPRGHSDGVAASTSDSPDMPGLWTTFVTLWAKKTFRHMILGGSMYGLIMVAVLIWIPSFFVRTHGLEIGVIGTWLAFTNAVPHAIGILAGGVIADRLAKKGVRGPILLCVFAQVIATPFYALVLLWPDSTGAFLWLIIPSLVGVMQGPVLFATIQSISSVQTRAVAAALMILIINLISGIIGPQLVGLVSDLTAVTFGSESLGFSLLAVATVCGFWSAFHFYLASRAIEDELT
ncbi:MAG: MFS transporter [Rhodospirillaceae bacterium]|jgi:MFS family permease|nr:MFS transporter [Rhodospirillaceae bacterium]MBT5564815.1 MFS transporter [Rhodospirillaceae bacterium]MBT6088022.1 MFS transporter [Rhodospirillaceae bacterium]